ncbi:MAG: M42 family metallopeptidase [Candidatus Lokiarchaeota archaeon]|nr:M42 family metallopeptidase [Candidatus Lokiarchaeota archaeon]
MMFEENIEIIKNLTEIQSCSGNESKIRDYIKNLVKPYCTKIETDVLGNLFCIIEGTAKPPDQKMKVLLDAHMDEIGFMVRFIDKNGFIRFSQVGGQNPRILPGAKVTVHSSSGEDILGVIGETPIHLLKTEERKKAANLEDLFIDIGLENDKQVKEIISIGDYVTLKEECSVLKGNKRICSKAFDDRAGCFVLIKLIMELSSIKDKLDKNIVFQFASQEEIGVRGATVGAFRNFPDLAIAVEVTHAIDFPGISKDKFNECNLGSGVSISIGPNLHPKLSKSLVETAKRENIPFVLEPEPRPTPTDARAIQMTKTGVPCALVSTPLRYMHTNIEVIEYQDLLYTIQLLRSFLSEPKNPLE